MLKPFRKCMHVLLFVSQSRRVLIVCRAHVDVYVYVYVHVVGVV